MSNDVMVKKTVEEWLNTVDYEGMRESGYVPSTFALNFVNFIKLVNGNEGESNLTPVVHLKMLDELAGMKVRLANLCSRGLAKTTLFGEYLTLYIALYGEIDGFGEISGMIYVSDSMENGAKSLRKNIEYRYENSDFLKKYIPEAKFTDAFLEFKNADGHRLGVRLFGAKALSLDTPLFLASGGMTTIGECRVGDVIIGANGKPSSITKKSEVFHKPMYELVLQDGRKLKVSEDHLNQVHLKSFTSPKSLSNPKYVEKTLSTEELLKLPLFMTDHRGGRRPLVWVENCKPVEWAENTDQLIDAYSVGVMLGDGSMNTKAGGSSPAVLTAHEDDWPFYEEVMPYHFGKVYRDRRNPKTISRTVLGINLFAEMLGINTHGSVKKVPDEYKYASIDQRLAVLQGLMDTDGTCTKEGKTSFCSASKQLVEDVMWLCRSLGGESRWVNKGNVRAYMCTVRLNMPVFKLPRKLARQRGLRNDKLAIVEINPIAMEPSQCIAIDNEERQFIAGDFFRTHNTGLRGTKVYGKRPTLAVLDDLVSDDDSKSVTVMNAIKDTVYKGVDYALDPTKRKIVFSGTPFNKGDILYEAVESGGWYVNVFPICEKFPCSKEEFVGAWEDRFSYEFVKSQYDMSLATGQISAFNQELMLRITSEEDRLIPDSCINWYSRSSLLLQKESYNFYITTDFATSAKKSADYSVIAVWGYNNKGYWFLVDGICKRQEMSANIEDLFTLAQKWDVKSVGIEVTGQQNGFVSWVQKEMMSRGQWFSLASNGNNNAPGMRPTADKLNRFYTVEPWFKKGIMFFPEELKGDGGILDEMLHELSLATKKGFLSKHDDAIDCVSMLSVMTVWKPSAHSTIRKKGDPMWEDWEDDAGGSSLGSYTV